jgi:exosortase/archaeosortase family protein
LFPKAFVVLPIGIGAIWLLNTARVAALVSLGAHVSPEVAIGGFHSQAGWIASPHMAANAVVLHWAIAVRNWALI